MPFSQKLPKTKQFQCRLFSHDCLAVSGKSLFPQIDQLSKVRWAHYTHTLIISITICILMMISLSLPCCSGLNILYALFFFLAQCGSVCGCQGGWRIHKSLSKIRRRGQLVWSTNKSKLHLNVRTGEEARINKPFSLYGHSCICIFL